jgi:hypothetical protein
MIRANTASYKEIYSRNIDQAIEGLTANASTKQIFSSKSPSATTPAFTRSTTCWAKNIDTSPQSIWNNHTAGSAPLNAGGYGGSGTLISPRHIVYADHYQFANGTTLVFVNMSNTSFTRTLSSSIQVGSTDIRIGLLNSDITNVSFAKILDLEVANQTNLNVRLPALFMDQDRNALVGEYYSNGSSALCISPTDSAQRTAFYETPVGGDSGNPVCLVYENKIILTFTFFTSTSSDSLSYNINDINSAMTSLGGGYTATTFKLDDLASRAEIGKTILTNRGGNLGKVIFGS